MTFDSIAYWLARGNRYATDFSHTPAFSVQENALLVYLARLQYSTVLEIGCGFGRITELVRPGRSEYVGIDVSPAQIAAAKLRVPDVEYHVASIEDWRTSRDFDLVLAVEVLMHIPPSRIGDVLDEMLTMTGQHLVAVEWTGDGSKAAPHNWSHDYAALLPTATITPIEGIDQSIIHVGLGR